MFKKLKDKIAEEVKSSPQRIQQLTQSVVQNISSNDGNLFSIADDEAAVPRGNDHRQQQQQQQGGFTDVSLHGTSTPNNSHAKQRRNSNTSMASDVSFLPRYESPSNQYHLQSDVDMSVSEMDEDSTSVSKEQIYQAFRKAQMRYHKYRGRYADLSNHYRELERENGKMKSVLVETQDKALRRVSELKEQCNLEKSAKAHLENALRVELDERQYVIDTLRTKVKLLDGGTSDEPRNGETDDRLDRLVEDLNAARDEIETLDRKLRSNQTTHDRRQTELTTKVAELEKLLDDRNRALGETEQREKENNLILAQNKMELHVELETREKEVVDLKRQIDSLSEENRLLTDRIDDVSVENRRLHDEIDRVRNDTKRGMIDLQTKMMEKEATLRSETEKGSDEVRQRLENDIKELNETMAALRLASDAKDAELVAINAKYSSLNDTIREDDETMRELQLSVRNAELIVAEKDTTNADLMEQLDALAAQNESLEAFRTELETQLRSVETDNARIKAERSRSLDDFDASMRSTVDGLERKLKSTTVRVTQLELSIEAATVERQTVCDRLDAATKTNDELKSTAADLELQLRQRESSRRSYEAERTELLQQLDDLRVVESKYDRYVEESASLRASCEAEKQKCTDLTTENERLATELTVLNNRLIDYDETMQTIGAVREENVHLKQDNDNLITENASLKDYQNKFHDVMEEKLGLETTINTLREEYRAVRLTYAVANDETVELRRRLDEIRNELDAVRTEKNAFESLLDGRSEDVRVKDRLTDELRTIKERLSVEEEENVSLRRSLEEQRSGVETFRIELDGLRRTLAEQATEKAALKSLVDEKMEQLARNEIVVSKMESLKQRLVEADRETLDERSKKERLLVDTDDLRRRLDEEATKNEALVGEADRLRSQLADEADEKMNLTALLHEKSEQAVRNEKLLVEMSGVRQQLLEETQVNASLKSLLEEKSQRIANVERLLEDERVESQRLERERLKANETITERSIGKNEAIETDDVRKRLEVEVHRLKSQIVQLEEQLVEVVSEKQLLRDEMNEMKISPVGRTVDSAADLDALQTEYEKTLLEFRTMEETNRSTIGFYEGQVEKLQNKNDKLLRKLDETLVTLGHFSELSGSTEIEYLRNVLYNYMLGKESLVLARVIAAVCKFDPTQTEIVLQKEQQKQTLLGQLGIL